MTEKKKNLPKVVPKVLSKLRNSVHIAFQIRTMGNSKGGNMHWFGFCAKL